MASYLREVMAKLIKPKPAPKPAPKLGPDAMNAVFAEIEQYFVAEDQQEARKKIVRPYVMLSPVVPLPATSTAGWFGGAPRLPKGVDWPKIDGEPGQFLCQIDLAALPQNMWNGVGPRNGWLAVFIHPQAMKPVVLHVTGQVFRRYDGPAQGDADWFFLRGRDGNAVHPRSPEWPIEITSRVGPLPATAGYKKGFAPGFPDPRKGEVFEFANRAMAPFDAASVEALLRSIEGEVDHTQSQITALLAKKIPQTDRQAVTPTDREAMAHSSTLVAAILAEVADIRRKIAVPAALFDLSTVSTLLQTLAALQTPTVKYLDNDKEGNAVIEVTENVLGAALALDQPRWPCWQRGYLTLLYQHMTKLYLADPASVPPIQKTRLEAILAFEAAHEHGAMGHAPSGHLHTPYGPGTPTEILLELPTSDLIGWCWGDMYRVAFFINRDRLEQGCFDGVTAEITN